MGSDHVTYAKFHSRSNLDKAINTLLGLLEGVAIDKKISMTELEFLRSWLDEHQHLSSRHPYNELFPIVCDAVQGEVLTREMCDDLMWLCEKLVSTEFYDRTTADLQRLHAVVAGIIADGKITIDELNGLSEWLTEHAHLASCWPYDEVYSLVSSVRQDGKIDEREHQMLRAFFSEFLDMCNDPIVTNPLVQENGSLLGLCAMCPEITISDSVFCFTGASARYSRKELSELVESLGGTFSEGLNKKVNYLIVGSDGNPCWAYACYGRKVEKAVEYRKAGVRLMIVHENDFHDAVLDQR